MSKNIDTRNYNASNNALLNADDYLSHEYFIKKNNGSYTAISFCQSLLKHLSLKPLLLFIRRIKNLIEGGGWVNNSKLSDYVFSYVDDHITNNLSANITSHKVTQVAQKLLCRFKESNDPKSQFYRLTQAILALETFERAKKINVQELTKTQKINKSSQAQFDAEMKVKLDLMEKEKLRLKEEIQKLEIHLQELNFKSSESTDLMEKEELRLKKEIQNLEIHLQELNLKSSESTAVKKEDISLDSLSKEIKLITIENNLNENIKPLKTFETDLQEFDSHLKEAYKKIPTLHKQFREIKNFEKTKYDAETHQVFCSADQLKWLNQCVADSFPDLIIMEHSLTDLQKRQLGLLTQSIVCGIDLKRPLPDTPLCFTLVENEGPHLESPNDPFLNNTVYFCTLLSPNVSAFTDPKIADRFKIPFELTRIERVIINLGNDLKTLLNKQNSSNVFLKEILKIIFQISQEVEALNKYTADISKSFIHTVALRQMEMAKQCYLNICKIKNENNKKAALKELQSLIELIEKTYLGVLQEKEVLKINISKSKIIENTSKIEKKTIVPIKETSPKMEKEISLENRPRNKIGLKSQSSQGRKSLRLDEFLNKRCSDTNRSIVLKDLEFITEKEAENKVPLIYNKDRSISFEGLIKIVLNVTEGDVNLNCKEAQEAIKQVILYHKKDYVYNLITWIKTHSSFTVTVLKCILSAFVERFEENNSFSLDPIQVLMTHYKENRWDKILGSDKLPTLPINDPLIAKISLLFLKIPSDNNKIGDFLEWMWQNSKFDVENDQSCINVLSWISVFMEKEKKFNKKDLYSEKLEYLLTYLQNNQPKMLEKLSESDEETNEFITRKLRTLKKSN